MVLTRSQAAKTKAEHSPEVAKQPRKKQAEGGAAAAAPGGAGREEEARAGGSAAPGMGAQSSKLARLRTGPASHPIHSLPASPAAPSPGPGVQGEFTIAAGVRQEQGQQHWGDEPADALAANVAARQQQPEASPAVTVERRQPGASGDEPVDSRPADEAPAPGPAVPPEQAAAPQQQPQPPRPQPRPEKLLKPLPDKPVPCDKLPDGPEPVQVDVEYLASEDLQPVDDLAAALAAVAPALAAEDWVEAVGALNLLRQLVAHHPEACAPRLDELMPLVLKSVRNLRSSVCKTAIMAVADLYTAFGDALLPHTDVGGLPQPATSLLAQLLLKCAGDKKFVVEEAHRALQVMVGSLAPAACLGLLLPYAERHRNPKVRGKAGGALAQALARMQPAEVLACGLPQLLRAGAKLVTDKTPDARESAKRVLALLKATFADPAVAAALVAEAPAPAAPAEGEEAAGRPTPWETYCRASLGGSAALDVIRASSD